MRRLRSLKKRPTDLPRLIEDAVEIPETSRSGKLPEDFAEELLGIDGGPAAPVLLTSAAGALVEPGRAVRVVLFPLHLVTEHLKAKHHVTHAF